MAKDELSEISKHFVEFCVKNEQSFGLAESCTGGLISSKLTEIPGVSAVFKGAIVSYSSQVKIDILGVPKSLIQCLGEVSQPVALYMARGARDVLDCRWAISVSGIAGPNGGSQDKPVGTVCFALCGPGVETSIKKVFDNQGRTDVQKLSATFALQMALENMNS